MTERPLDALSNSSESRPPDPDATRPADLDDLDIGHAEPPASASRKRRPPLALLVVAVVLSATTIWFVVSRREPGPAQPNAEVVANEPAPAAAVPALGSEPADITVPPLDESDAVVRQLVRQLTSHPAIARWLATDGLIRNFTVVVANIADRTTPSRHLRALRPADTFATVAEGSRLVIDQSSYRRFDGFAAAAASVDAAGAARLYTTLKPRIEEAYRDLGHPDASVDRALETAIVELLRTPVVEGPVVVTAGTKGIGYVYANRDLEALSPPQKQLVRMGPVNTRAIQRALRAIALALGIPAERLPQEVHG
jgi:hypothetical protein